MANKPTKLPERPTKAKPRNLVVVTVEGPPQSGKNTIAALIARYLEKHGVKVAVSMMVKEATDAEVASSLSLLQHEYRERKATVAVDVERKKQFAVMAERVSVHLEIKQTKRA